MDGCKLTLDMLDSRGNRESGWEEGGKRAGIDYIHIFYYHYNKIHMLVLLLL